MRPDRVAEPRLVLAALETVGAAVLAIRPASRKVAVLLELVVNDRAVPQRRPENEESALPQHSDEGAEPFGGDDRGLGLQHCSQRESRRVGAAREGGYYVPRGVTT